MVNTHNYKNLVWVDIESPKSEDIKEIVNTYGIDPSVAQDLLFPSANPTVEKYSNFVYAVFHFPAWRHTHREKVQEIDFIIGKEFLITVRYDTIDALHKFAKVFEVSEVLDKRKVEAVHAGTLFYFMMKEIYQALRDELAAAHDLLSDIEDKMFHGRERDMVRELSKLSREFLVFRQATELQDDTLAAFRIAAIGFFGEGYEYEADLIQKEYSQVKHLADGYMASLDELRNTNDSLLSNKQNEIMQALTVIIFITSALSIFIGLFTIDSSSRPIIGMPYDFWILVGIMVVLALGFVWFFIKKEWL